MGVKIPKEKHKPKRRMSQYVWLIYGPPKVGKTTFANQWNDALFLATEPGTAAMEAAEIQISSWTDFTNTVKGLRDQKHRWKTVVVDTVDNLYEFLQDDVCNANGWVDLGDPGFGKGHKLARRKLSAAIANLRALDMALVFVSHERQEKEIDDNGKRAGTTFITSALPGSARKVLHGSVDFIFRAEVVEGGARQLRTTPFLSDELHIECGQRGELGRPLPETMELSFAALAAEFKRAFSSPDAGEDKEGESK